MSEEYNPEAQLIEQIERLEVELKEVIAKRDQTAQPKEKAVLQRQVDDLEARIKHLQGKLA